MTKDSKATEYVVDNFSLSSLRIEALVNGIVLGSATGFVVEVKHRHFFITNWHVVSGRHPDSGEVIHPSGAVPDTLEINHHSALARYGYGVWTIRDEALYDSHGTPRWFEHPKWSIKDMEHPNERNADIAVLPLSNVDDINLYSLNLATAYTDILIAPGLPVSIIGYPFGYTGADLFPIWKTGHIASDINAHYSKRFFYVDAITRSGMSGSPVVFRGWANYQVNSSDVSNTSGIITRFMGIYSGRVSGDAEIGIVWRPELLQEILELV